MKILFTVILIFIFFIACDNNILKEQPELTQILSTPNISTPTPSPTQSATPAPTGPAPHPRETEIAKLLPADGDQGDEFGVSIS